MESTWEKSVRLPTFNGAHKDFQVWWSRFKEFSAVYKFVEASKVGGETDMPVNENESIDESTDDGKKRMAAKKRNATAMANLTMAFTSESTMGLVYKAMSDDWPGGLAHLVVEALFKEYRPVDPIT